jgi:hypothetical protein
MTRDYGLEIMLLNGWLRHGIDRMVKEYDS